MILNNKREKTEMSYTPVAPVSEQFNALVDSKLKREVELNRFIADLTLTYVPDLLSVFSYLFGEQFFAEIVQSDKLPG